MWVEVVGVWVGGFCVGGYEVLECIFVIELFDVV